MNAQTVTLHFPLQQKWPSSGVDMSALSWYGLKRQHCSRSAVTTSPIFLIWDE